MDNKEAKRRLEDHFRIHNDGRPTPYLDEAVSLAYEALELKQKIIDVIRTHRFTDSECIEHISKLVGIWHESETTTWLCPCIDCERGWGSISRYGIKTCNDECKKYLQWKKRNTR